MWAPWDEYGKRHALHMATALTWTLPLHEHHAFLPGWWHDKPSAEQSVLYCRPSAAAGGMRSLRCWCMSQSISNSQWVGLCCNKQRLSGVLI